MNQVPNRCAVNLLRPKKGYMRDEVRIILVILVGWAALTFGFQALLAWGEEGAVGRFLTERYLFNLPLHFFFTAQFLPLWFIFLCVIFNLYVDRITEYHSHRRDRSYE